MSKFNLQSLAFALVVLFLVLLAPNEGRDEVKTPTTGSIESTSLTSNVAERFTRNIPKSSPLVNPLRTASLESRPRVLNFLIPEPMHLVHEAPTPTAAAALVIEAGNSSPYFEKNSDKRWPLASLTKLMTAVVALENFNADQRVMMNEAALAAPGEVGNFVAGEVFTAADLLKALISASSNDAALALAELYGAREFMDLMQVKTADLGMYQTTFSDPAGLSVLNQSTVNDLKKLVDYILKNHPFIFRTARAASVTLNELTSGTTRVISSNNQFAGRPDFVGGKTGYTDDANGNLLSIFRHQNREFLIIVFGTRDRFGETEKLWHWLKTQL